MATLLSAAALLVGLVLLWTWRRGLEVTSFQATLLSVIEVAGFLLSIATLGWVGVAIFILVGVVAILTWSVVLALRKDRILTAAAVQGAELDREGAEELWHWMGREGSFGAVRPLLRAELICSLAGLARDSDEIRAMAPPIAALSLIFDCEPLWLAPRFDRLLRLYGHEAADAEAVADTLTAATQRAADSFENMVEGMIVAGGGGPASGAEAWVGTRPGEADPDRLAESLRAVTELQIHAEGEEGVRLGGGPMDGYLVRADAPVLGPDWYRTWPPRLAARNRPGRYLLSADRRRAQWASI
jgi:hypothetical protein